MVDHTTEIRNCLNPLERVKDSTSLQNIKYYQKLKSLLPDWVRSALGSLNQKFFARETLKWKYGDWFDVDWRKKFRNISDSEWKAAYDKAWLHRRNDCVEETDAELIMRALDGSGFVLEVGCGAGGLAILLARGGYAVTGIDVSTEALRLASEKAEKENISISWKEGFAERLPFLDKSFDFITCCHTLEHVRNIEEVVKEFKRVARKKIVVLVPKQSYKLYAENYHTHFFETEDQLIRSIGCRKYSCREIDATDHKHEFQGKAFLYVGILEGE